MSKNELPSLSMEKILAVIPAYNEESSIETLLKQYDFVFQHNALDLSILVVNDGSKDNTVGVVQKIKSKIKIDIYDNEKNGGLGKVIRDGLVYACVHLADDDIVITMDADNSHNPNLIIRMVQQIREGSDIVIASRYRIHARTYGVSLFRIFTSLMAAWLFVLFAPIKGVRDYTCGFRAYRVSLLRKGLEHFGNRFIEENGFSCMAEILLKLKIFNPIYHEIPMILRYDLKKGESKMNIFKTVKNSLILLWQYRFTSRFK
ncbi:MAG: glycosyltransferase family 2 protein [Saprospiraceae bacterium]